LLGVAGYRAGTPQLEAASRTAFRTILQDLRTSFMRTRLVVLSTLAPGAESAAVDEAFAQHVDVVACLPSPPASCEERLDESQRERFRTLLAGCTETRVAAGGETSEDAAFRAGTYVSHFSDILVVFESDADAEDASNASALVTLRETGKVRGRKRLRRLLDPPDVATYYRVALPEQAPGGAPSSEGASGATAAITKVYPPRYRGDSQSEADFIKALRRLDRFNADLHALPAQAAGGLLSERLLASTDELANHLQRLTLFWQRCLYWFAFIAASMQIALPNSAPGSIAKVVAVVATLAIYVKARRDDYQSRYQDYRAIGEGLRVQTVWSYAGVPERVDASYLRMQQTELLWLRSVLRTVSFLQADHMSAEEPQRIAGWVTGQRGYFKAAASGQGARRRFLSLVITILAPINLAASALLLIVLSVPAQWLGGWSWLSDSSHKDALRRATAVCAGLAALTVGVLTSYMRARAFAENANRYQRMFLIFDEADRLLQGAQPERDEEIREIARELGREALAEQAEWLLMQRERPLALVQTAAQ